MAKRVWLKSSDVGSAARAQLRSLRGILDERRQGFGYRRNIAERREYATSRIVRADADAIGFHRNEGFAATHRHQR